MLENNLENRLSEIQILTEKLRNNGSFDCESYKVTDKSGSDAETHLTEHTEENTPSTSKCGKCPYESDDEKDMNVHIKQNHKTNVLTCDVCSFKSEDADTLSKHKTEQHEIKCDYCDFITQWKESHDLHLAEHHKFRCTKCKLAHNDSWKHNIHTCKVDIDNPTFKSFYSKAWLDQNGCNPVYCTERNEDVAWLHNDKCWSGELPCSWPPHIYRGKSIFCI